MERLTCWTSLVILAIFLCHLQTATACSCIFRHPQSKFCDSEFVALVTVEEFLSANESNYIVPYKIHVNETFKATPSAQTLLEQKPVLLWTRSNLGLCGLIGLQPDDTWVVGGIVAAGKLQISSCDLGMPWFDIIPTKHDNFRKFFQAGCADCQISYKYEKSADNTTCYMWQRPDPEGYCQERFDTCMLGSAGCSWTPCKKTT